MNIAIVAHNSLRLVFIFAAVCAVFLRLASNLTRIYWEGAGLEELESGHRISGWIGIISIMSLLFWGSYDPDSIPDFTDRLVYLHIPLLLICSAAILYKAYKEDGNILQQEEKLRISWMVIFVFGALFSFAVAAMFIRKFELFQANLPALYIIPYSILVIAHAGLAFGIVVIRYIQENLMHGGNPRRSYQSGKELIPSHDED